MAYEINNLVLETLIGATVRATEALARLDERLARSPVRDGWIERQNFADACAALWLEGELVHVEDLVLHDAHMDIRTPTHELTRAHGVLRARRQIFSQRSDWALSQAGLRQLTRRIGAVVSAEAGGAASQEGDESPAQLPLDTRDKSAKVDMTGDAFATPPVQAAYEVAADDDLTKALKTMEAVLERSAKVLDGRHAQSRGETPGADARPALVYDLDWDEDARLAEWQDVIAATRTLPGVLRAAILIDAWDEIEVLQHAPWLGPLLVAALLRQDGIASNHLPALHFGAKQIPRERRRARARTERLLAMLNAIQQAAILGMKEHDRLMLAKSQMERRMSDKRSNSRLPQLIELMLSRPLVSSSMIQQALKVSKQGALNLVGELALREMTGRGRFRAWGVV
jgi:Protein of unknown function (DUF1612)/HTH DNA binding domain